ncbi:MAG: hypothetical protein JWO60_2841, partial [Frankiales bacterium]|nr:hypothetical protein [Frankiales bacterium]
RRGTSAPAGPAPVSRDLSLGGLLGVSQ